MIRALSLEELVVAGARGERDVLQAWRSILHPPLDRTALILALWSIPVSIAVAEFFLTIAVLVRAFRILRRQDHIVLPRCFWFWLVWAGAEIAAWSFSPQLALGWAEIRHLFLLGAMFLVLPALRCPGDSRVAWQGIFLTSTLSSAVLIADFVSRLFHYRPELRVGGDVALYLRSGGLSNHWMIYGTLEVIVVAALLNFWSEYPEHRLRWWPVFLVHAAAIVVSLTRMVWITCLVLLGMHLARRRTRWVMALPVMMFCLYWLAPTPVRLRLQESFDPNYYSNLERVEMLRVSWKMVREHPLTGVGPGRVDQLYTKYLTSRDALPAWHGHLHNNLAQLAAQFGIPATLAALLFVISLVRDILKACRAAQDRERKFIALTAIFALTAFLFAGLFEYTYGHSLGLILLSFAVLPAYGCSLPESLSHGGRG